MNLKQQIEKLEKALERYGGNRHVIVDFENRGYERALSDYKRNHYIHLDDQIFYFNLNLKGD